MIHRPPPEPRVPPIPLKTRSSRLLATLAACALVSALACGDETRFPGLGEGTHAPPERIILIVIDTLRADHVSAYGSDIETPNIDAIAAQGRVYRNLRSSFHQTTMSMASLFTGRTPSIESGKVGKTLEWTGRSWCGMRRFADGKDDEACIPSSLPTLAQSLRDAGYWTAAVVTNALLFRPLGYDRGFDLWAEVGDSRPGAGKLGRTGDARLRHAGRANAAALTVLRRRPHDRFLLYFHLMDVHDFHIADMSYADGVRQADAGVGELMDNLAADGLLRDAVVIVVSDHGERFDEQHVIPGAGQHIGNPSFEEVLAVPLIIAPSPVEPPSHMIRSDDVTRLIQRIAGIEPESSPDLEESELFLTEMHFQTYRKGRYKSFRRRRGSEFVLVDLEDDPGERVDISGEVAEIAEAHRRRMDQLSDQLAVGNQKPTTLTAEDERRLRSLGYLE